MLARPAKRAFLKALTRFVSFLFTKFTHDARLLGFRDAETVISFVRPFFTIFAEVTSLCRQGHLKGGAESVYIRIIDIHNMSYFKNDFGGWGGGDAPLP